MVTLGIVGQGEHKLFSNQPMPPNLLLMRISLFMPSGSEIQRKHLLHFCAHPIKPLYVFVTLPFYGNMLFLPPPPNIMVSCFMTSMYIWPSLLNNVHPTTTLTITLIQSKDHLGRWCRCNHEREREMTDKMW